MLLPGGSASTRQGAPRALRIVAERERRLPDDDERFLHLLRRRSRARHVHGRTRAPPSRAPAEVALGEQKARPRAVVAERSCDVGGRLHGPEPVDDALRVVERAAVRTDGRHERTGRPAKACRDCSHSSIGSSSNIAIASSHSPAGNERVALAEEARAPSSGCRRGGSAPAPSRTASTASA